MYTYIRIFVMYTYMQTHCGDTTATHCNTYCLTATHCNTGEHTHVTLEARAMQHIAIHTVSLQYTLFPCHTLQHRWTRAQDARGTPCNTLRHNATHTLSYCNTHCLTPTHCNTLQHTATHCNTGERERRTLEAQHKALWAATPPHPAPYCNTLQNTPTHEDALQHAAPAPDSAECMDVGARCRELHHVKSLICDADTKKEKEEALLDSRIMESVAATNPYGMCVYVCLGFWV